MTVSAIVVTRNSASQIQACLEHLSWADEIVVVDLGSTDKTVEIASGFTTKVVSHAWVPYVELVREFGADLATGEWLLHIDPDEWVPATLASRLRQIAEDPSMEFSGVRMARQLMVHDRWIQRHSWPDFQLRFGRRGSMHFAPIIHDSGQTIDGKILDLPAEPAFALTHFAVSNLPTLFERVNRYAQFQAEELFALGVRFDFGRLLAEPIRRFHQAFLVRQSYRDGIIGLIMSLSWRFMYPLLIELYLWELSGHPGSGSPEGPARSTLGLARRALAYPEIRQLAKDILAFEFPLARRIASWHPGRKE